MKNPEVDQWLGQRECWREGCVQFSMAAIGSASQGLRWEGLSGCVVARHAIPAELGKRGIHAV